MMNRMEGIVVPLLTPVNEREEINYEQLKNLTDYVIRGGVNGIFVNGTTGEFARFSIADRQKIVRVVVEAANGRVPVAAGVSECGTRRVLENIKAAEEAGADAVVTTMPYYFPTSSVREQIEFVKDVTEAAELPVMLYNIPSVMGYALTEELLDEVCDIDNLYGIKDSSGQKESFDRLWERYHDKLQIFVGAEELNYYGLIHGAAGLVPSLANVFPGMLKRVWESSGKGDWETCKEQCALVDEMNRLNHFSDSWMSPNIWRKEALAQMGIISAAFTRPYQPVPEKEKHKIAQWITYYKERYEDGRQVVQCKE